MLATAVQRAGGAAAAWGGAWRTTPAIQLAHRGPGRMDRVKGRRFGAKLRRTDFGILASAGWLEGIWRYDAGDGEGGVRGE